MAAVQLLGMTHYPPFGWRPATWGPYTAPCSQIRAVPADARDIASWPTPQQEEWGRDDGVAGAIRHRDAILAGIDTVHVCARRVPARRRTDRRRRSVRDFTETVIPPYCLLAYNDIDAQPWLHQKRENYLHEPPDATFHVRGRPDIGRAIATDLLNGGFDMAYAYKPLTIRALPTHFLNTILYLDHRREGFPYPVVSLAVNCYGSKVISFEGVRGHSASKLISIPPPGAVAPWTSDRPSSSHLRRPRGERRSSRCPRGRTPS